MSRNEYDIIDRLLDTIELMVPVEQETVCEPVRDEAIPTSDANTIGFKEGEEVFYVDGWCTEPNRVKIIEVFKNCCMIEVNGKIYDSWVVPKGLLYYTEQEALDAIIKRNNIYNESNS